jgi:hypothetical protein
MTIFAIIGATAGIIIGAFAVIQLWFYWIYRNR